MCDRFHLQTQTVQKIRKHPLKSLPFKQYTPNVELIIFTPNGVDETGRLHQTSTTPKCGNAIVTISLENQQPLFTSLKETSVRVVWLNLEYRTEINTIDYLATLRQYSLNARSSRSSRLPPHLDILSHQVTPTVSGVSHANSRQTTIG
ncbi:MAG: hypothetical protein LUQ11_12040 [Methylococcaceae bacterium]|nr:hypothetical protein [Methylococcaceae bacterium]